MSSSLTSMIRPYQPSDADAVLAHLQTCFRLHSPLFSGLEMSENDSLPFFQQLIEDAERAEISYVACDNEGLIIGCVLASIEDREDSKHQAPPSLQLSTPKQNVFADFVDQLYAEPLKNFATARILKLDLFSVAPEYRRHQLCRRMVQLCTEDAVTKKSCDVALVLATSHKSQALMADEKYITMKLRYFEDYNKERKEGEPTFVMKDPMNTVAKVMAKILT